MVEGCDVDLLQSVCFRGSERSAESSKSVVGLIGLSYRIKPMSYDLLWFLCFPPTLTFDSTTRNPLDHTTMTENLPTLSDADNCLSDSQLEVNSCLDVTALFSSEGGVPTTNTSDHTRC
jgi:hypothetical protein